MRTGHCSVELRWHRWTFKLRYRYGLQPVANLFIFAKFISKWNRNKAQWPTSLTSFFVCAGAVGMTYKVRFVPYTSHLDWKASANVRDHVCWKVVSHHVLKRLQRLCFYSNYIEIKNIWALIIQTFEFHFDFATIFQNLFHIRLIRDPGFLSAYLQSKFFAPTDRFPVAFRW